MFHSAFEPARISARKRFRLVLLLVSLCVLAGIVASGRAAGRWPLARAQVAETLTPTGVTQPGGSLELMPTSSPAAEAAPASPAPELPIAQPEPGAEGIPNLPVSDAAPFASGTLFFALGEAGATHLYAYRPQGLPFTRLTDGDWDDLAPAASPDGRLAFVSNRSGHWDLYVLDLHSGALTQVTNTPEYESNPSWSPDGRWLAYETFVPYDGAGSGSSGNGDLEIFIRPVVDDGTQPVRLTDDPAADTSPAWSPNGRQIAYVSNRSGEEEIWLADLDKVEDRFINLSQNSQAQEAHPAWSPDGKFLAWSARQDGFQNLIVRQAPAVALAASDVAALPAQSEAAGSQTVYLGSGDWLAWNPASSALFASVQMPNRSYLTGYPVQSEGLLLPPIALPGKIAGLCWSAAELSGALPAAFLTAASLTPSAAWLPALSPKAGALPDRQQVVTLNDVQAPYPMLQDLMDESFQALRQEVARATGWDALASLENAYVPLTAPLFPGMMEDWLYTGRAIALNTAPLNAGWMAIVREDFGGATYWRVYLRVRFQDGSQGQPLLRLPWDLNARNNGNPHAYEQGGALASALPPGYWLDFTDLAASYGWERLPALSSWRYAYPAARYNEFVLTGGQSWLAAMHELYPAEALVTPTQIIPPTRTPTRVLPPTRTPTPTRTPWPSRTPSATPTQPLLMAPATPAP